MTGKDFAQEAADRLNAAAPKMGFKKVWDAEDYGTYPEPTALADTLAEQAQDRAELAAIKADMADVHIKLSASYGLDRLPYDTREMISEAHDIAAKYRAEIDPLVEAFNVLGWDRNSKNGDRVERLRAELAKRGIELAQGGAK